MPGRERGKGTVPKGEGDTRRRGKCAEGRRSGDSELFLGHELFIFMFTYKSVSSVGFQMVDDGISDGVVYHCIILTPF